MQAHHESASSQVLHLRKYPNRRYYDPQHSRHVTLDEIYDLVLAGHDIRVTATKTGEDITAQVLTQIMLDHDPPKLEAFSVDVLHQLLRANQRLVSDFMEKYFNQAMSSFLRSQRQIDQFLRQSVGLASPMELARGWWGGFGAHPQEGNGEPADEAAATEPELRRALDELRKEVARLREQVGEDPASDA
jgi:polyhydroxyalkanoate synthesis repressor PhaR